MVEKSMTHPLVRKFSKNKKEPFTLGFAIMAAIFLFYPFKTESFYVVDKQALLEEQIHKRFPAGLVSKEELIKTTKSIDALIEKVQKQTGYTLIDATTALAIKTTTPQATAYLESATNLIREELSTN